MNERIFQDIQSLCALRGISGREDAVRAWLIAQLPQDTAYTVDALGNLLVQKQGRQRAKRCVLLAAHMDEVGLLIRGVTDEGFLLFHAISMDSAVLCGRAVQIGENAIPGVIGLKPIHLLEGKEARKLPKAEDLHIDIGATSREEALALVQIGDMATFDAQPQLFGDGFFRARALDDRAGCGILLALLRSDLPYDISVAFTVQEEVGLRGAQTAAFALEPNYAIVVETTTAADLPGIENEKRVCVPGKGAVISFMDSSTVYDAKLFQHALALAQRRGIAAQVKTQVAGGNDAGAIHKSRAGVKTLSVSLPCRYLHSPSCVIQTQDIGCVYALVSALYEEYANGMLD